MAQTNQGFNLTKATKTGRGVVKWGTIAIVVLIVGRFAVEGAITFYRMLNPPPPPPPTQGFGQLPPLDFPEQDQSEEPISITQEFPFTTFPYFGDRAEVFFIPDKTPSLLDTDRANELASSFGFREDGEPLGAQQYRWSKTQPITSTLEMNILTYNLNFTTDYLTRPELILNQNVPTTFDSVQRVKTFLGRGGLLPSDMATASGQVRYLRSVGGELRPAVAAAEADFVEVNIFRTPLHNNFPFYTVDGKTGPVSAIISGNSMTEGVVDLARNYFAIHYELPHTYYLRSTESAWQMLSAGEGYIANPGTSETAIVRSVQLGYYDSFEYQEYMQPVYIFTGDGGFTAYVPALTPESYQKTETP
ncbi:MAG: hypothetical protein WDZ94_04395 [Patescibacteria group bacterium]